jgi:hypothetical protein
MKNTMHAPFLSGLQAVTCNRDLQTGTGSLHTEDLHPALGTVDKGQIKLLNARCGAGAKFKALPLKSHCLRFIGSKAAVCQKQDYKKWQ